MSELEQLRKKRGLCKAALSRFKTYLTNFDINSDSHSELKARLDKLKTVSVEFDNIQDSIDLLVDCDAEMSEREEFESNYFSLFGKATDILQPLGISNNNQSTSASTASPAPTENGPQSIKLPTISLPVFTGAYDQWLSFRDTFESLIHSNASLSNVQKLHYLRSSLRNEAARVLLSLDTTDNNYEIAWDLLKKRFENKRLIINNHLKAMFNLPVLKSESYSGLQNLYDNFEKNLRALQSLGQNVSDWDTIIVYLISSKFDCVTLRDWELTKFQTETPTRADIEQFLQERCRMLDTIEKSNTSQKNVKSLSYVITNDVFCNYCKNSHKIYSCPEFIKLQINQRIAEAKRLQLCLNCLRKNHQSSSCKFGTCRKCNKKHHTLLHLPLNNQPSVAQVNVTCSAQTNQEEEKTVYTACNTASDNQHSVLLATALVGIADNNGDIQICRALLDSGSQSNFIVSSICTKLGLQLKPLKLAVCGIGQNTLNINSQTNISFQSLFDSFTVNAEFLVVPQITSRLPTTSFDPSLLNIPTELNLADKYFFDSSNVDLLLGASIFWSILRQGQIKLGNGLPVLQNTRLGWIVSGSFYNTPQRKNIFCHFSKVIEDQLTRFWESEEINVTANVSKDDQIVENHYISTTRRDSDGRFIVSLPFRRNPSILGDTRSMALRRFYFLENRLQKNPKLKLEYQNFISEYLQLGHMSQVPAEDTRDRCYLPHHAVFKESSTTTRLRVVFDASAKSSKDICLNEIQYVGPTIQDDLFSILMRFRTHLYVMTADITKMYRQIWLNKDQRKLQTIFWRDDPSKPLNAFQLNTVTYGMAAAPFLAVRCLFELADQFESNYPTASTILKRDFYMDDMLTGADSIAKLDTLRNELSYILKTAGFSLSKWESNFSSKVFNQNSSANHVDFCKELSVKTLGIHWQPNLDILCYSSKAIMHDQNVTKRIILSDSARLFDPLGLITPITVVAKIILQRLWQLKSNWDDAVPEEIKFKWHKFVEGLNSLNKIQIPRFAVCYNPTSIQIHCFCDASEQAFGACVYIRTVSSSGTVFSNLLCSKSRIAPIKFQTIPRLELCSALLLSRLAEKIKQTLNLDVEKYYYWTDSQIALTWIRGGLNKWKTYVANRVSEINSITSISDWRHIKGTDNPADIITRGEYANTLQSQSLWWHGPQWLTLSEDKWPQNNFILVNPPEVKISLPSVLVESNLFSKYSSLSKLLNVTAYCYRFISNCRSPSLARAKSNLTLGEIKKATIILIKHIQNIHFNREISCLKQNKGINKKSLVLQLSPFLDTDGVLRVGGRLKNTRYHFEKRHPILLPAKHNFTKLLILHEHKILLHAGTQAVLASLRQKYWPLSARSTIKHLIRNCVDCFKAKPKESTIVMGELPVNRVNPARPFLNVGLDYAGPILIKERKLRNTKFIRAYICVFVCFATKAIHLEVVTDLSTEAFIATLRRFIARRGRPLNLYSDNGTQFKGADREIQLLFEFLSKNCNTITKHIVENGMQWHFIPPRAPHFGGLWEAGVKSTKHHLTRVIKNAHLTFEDLSTVLAQIEACLNSRPITPISNDPNDLTPLTPGHFLIGEPLSNLPDPDVSQISENRLNRFQRMQQLVQHFWKRWSIEYLSQLQCRNKWRSANNSLPIAVDSLVIIKEPNAPPLRWCMGRVLNLHPGADGIVRVATIKTTNGEVKRAVKNLCVLPIEK